MPETGDGKMRDEQNRISVAENVSQQCTDFAYGNFCYKLLLVATIANIVCVAGLGFLPANWNKPGIPESNELLNLMSAICLLGFWPTAFFAFLAWVLSLFGFVKGKYRKTSNILFFAAILFLLVLLYLDCCAAVPQNI